MRFRHALTRGRTQRLQLRYLVVVGGHHKAGSAWIGSVFRSIAKRHGLRFFAGEQVDLPRDADVFFQRHSRFEVSGLPRDYRGVHLIRDPRDVIVSGSYYHETASEAWLDHPRIDLGGDTYRHALGRLRTREAKVLFEMDHVGGETLNELLMWDRLNPAFVELKYEEVIPDPQFAALQSALGFVGLPPEAVAFGIRLAQQRSVLMPRTRSSSHVRSGMPGEWRSTFTRAIGRRFVDQFGDALVRLGYESDDQWILSLS